ncbi:MAG: hypothetical protein VX833_09365 [Actinomycetota bacterium]|nr:hypothetical protein [Actinomycetota bacterium]
MRRSLVGPLVVALLLAVITAVGLASAGAAVFLVVVAGFSWLMAAWSDRYRRN